MLALGKALKPLRDEGILLIGSGGTTHNLGAISRSAPKQPWAEEFVNFVETSLKLTGKEREQALLQYEKQPTNRLAHPRAEHFVPLFFALGAADEDSTVEIFNRGLEWSSFELSSFLWK